MSRSDSHPNKRNKRSRTQNGDGQTVVSADTNTVQNAQGHHSHFGIAHDTGFRQSFRGSIQTSFAENVSRNAHPHTQTPFAPFHPVSSLHYSSYGQTNGVPITSSTLLKGDFNNHFAHSQAYNGFHDAIPNPRSRLVWNSGELYHQQYQSMLQSAQQPRQQPSALPMLEGSSQYQTSFHQLGPQQRAIPQTPIRPLVPAMRSTTAPVQQKTWSCPSLDTTLPTTDRARQTWVLQIVNAIKNVDGVCDMSTPSFLKRWGPVDQDGEPFYSAMDVEIISWDVLTLAEQLHTEGPSVLKSFDTHFWQSAALSQSWTFAERMNKIIDLLAHSKARCDKLMQGVSLQSLIANPEKMMKVTKQNGIQNKKRQRTLEVGRRSMKRKREQSE